MGSLESDDEMLMGSTEAPDNERLLGAENENEASYRKVYTLPAFRFINIVRVVIIIDCLASLALWVTGGNTTYLVNSITHYSVTTSTFDLALLALVKTTILLIIYTYMEVFSMKELCNPYDVTFRTRRRMMHVLAVLFSLIILALVATKGGFILYKILNDSKYEKMHLTYNILTISAVSFSFIQVLFSLASFYGMRRLKNIRILHRYNNEGQEVDEQGQPIISRNRASLRRVIALVKPEISLLLLGSLCLIFSSASQTAAPYFFGLVVDAAQKSMDELNHTVLTLLVIYIIGSLASMFRSWTFTLAGQRMVARLRKDLFKSIIQQEVAFFDITRTGELTNRLSSDTQVVQNAITVNISMLLRYLLQIIGSLAFMFALNPALTGVLLSVVPIISLAAVQYGQFIRKLMKKFQDCLADASTTAEENISSIRTVRSFAGEAKANEGYGKDIDESYAIGKKLAFLQGAFEGTIGILSSGAITLVLWYGAKLVHEGHLTAGILTSFLLYTLQVAMAFAFLSSLYGDFMKAVGASERIFELMDRQPEVPIEGGVKLSNIDDGGIEFKDVNFTYPSRKETSVLKNVSFSVAPGQMVALVGPSGGGKSTIVSMIQRFYDVDSGTVLLGGQNIRELCPRWIRTQMSSVSQEPTLFACSILENITYGKNADKEEIEKIAQQANAHEFIQGFEEGYDTKVGERGVRLSGGQKQRVAIARALIMDPKILLLDEATSALDAESEHLVQEAIDRAMQNRTVLVIAHRLSTVRNASKVIVIDKGQIVEEGSHDELIAKNGVYKKLVLRQLTAGQITDEKEAEDDQPDENEAPESVNNDKEASDHQGNENEAAKSENINSENS